VHDIEHLLAKMSDAWNAGDAAAYAEVFTVDAQYISWLGTVDKGRAAIAATHDFLFNGPLKAVKMQGGGEVDIRCLTPDVALVTADGGKPEHAPVASVVTLVAVRTDDRWLFASFQNTRKTS
jgi:uncharacterized protein (TIGR02246 family)